MKKFMEMLTVSAVVLLFAGTVCLAVESRGTVDPVSGKPCYQCHRSKVSGPKIHDALAGNECACCHATTAGDHQRNHVLYGVRDKSAKLCWECHDSVASQKSVHPIITDEGCLGCHAPHSSPLRKLLRAEVPVLCFQCHERSLLKEQKTQQATGFRDGAENLHFVHAAKNAIACLVCHDVHASAQLHLIRAKGNNGKEAVTITYTATEKGGNCTTSCHDPQGYQRK